MFDFNGWTIVSLVFAVLILAILIIVGKYIKKYYPYLKYMDKKFITITEQVIKLDTHVYDLGRSYRLVQKKIMRDAFGDDSTQIKKVMYGEKEEELPFIQKNMFTEELKKNRQMEFDTARRKAQTFVDRMESGKEMKEISFEEDAIENTVELEEHPTLINPDHRYVLKFNQIKGRKSKYENIKTS